MRRISRFLLVAVLAILALLSKLWHCRIVAFKTETSQSNKNTNKLNVIIHVKILLNGKMYVSGKGGKPFVNKVLCAILAV